jgi:hypothetical protein
MSTKLQFDDFTLACLEAALRFSNDETSESGGNPLDQNYETANIDYSALVRLMENCERFQASPAWQAALAEDDPRTDRRQGYGCSVEESAGHDFWLTRCGHGAGFWSGDWKEPHASALYALSKEFGNVDLYVGDDGKIYAS